MQVQRSSVWGCLDLDLGGKLCGRSRGAASWRCIWSSPARWQDYRKNSKPSFCRYYSTREERETFDVRCGSAGSITVDLYNSQALTSPSAPLILYLPPTGTHLRSQHPKIPSYLRNPYAALASINYRWHIPSTSLPSTTGPLSSSSNWSHHPFPTPIHDTLLAYTFLTTSLLPKYTSPSLDTPPPTSLYSSQSSVSKLVQRPILIYGSYLGGTLATSLALTESFASKTTATRIAGLISKNGIYNWAEFSASLPKDPLPPSPSILEEETSLIPTTWNSKTLHRLVQKLFSNPASPFDPFASPMFFFRTSGIIIPSSFPTPPTPAPSPSPQSTNTPYSPQAEEYDQYGEPVFRSSPSNLIDPFASLSLQPDTSSPGKRIEEVVLGQEIPRRSPLKFPPRDSGLRIPRCLVLYSSVQEGGGKEGEGERKGKGKKGKKGSKKSKKWKDDVEWDGEISSPGEQALELTRLLRRSLLQHELKDRSEWDESLDPISEADERVKIVEINEADDQGEERVIREWIEDSLG